MLKHLQKLVLLLLCFTICRAYDSWSKCTTSGYFYDILLSKCTQCPTLTSGTVDRTYCNCSGSYYANPDVLGFNYTTSCLQLNTVSSTTPNIIRALDGGSTFYAVKCADNSYYSSANLSCIPCGDNQIYDSTLGACKCTLSQQYQFGGVCYTSTNTTVITDVNMQVAIVGCLELGLSEPCQQLINMCVKANYTGEYCTLLSSQPTVGTLPKYTFSSLTTDSIGIYASAIANTNTSTAASQLQFILFEYQFTGSIKDIRLLDKSIFPCPSNDQDAVDFMSFGLSMQKQCSSLNTFDKDLYYDIFVQLKNGSLVQVPIQISSTYYKRFKPGLYTSMNMKYVTTPTLRVPVLVLSSPSTTIGTISTSSTSSDNNINYLIPLAIVAVGIVMILALDFFRYLRYNPDQNNPYYCCMAALLLLVFSVKYIGVGLWIFLLGLATYVFCFFKFQQIVFLMLPDPSTDSTLYTSFQTLYFVQLALVILAVIILLINIGVNVDYFLIDWEKQKVTSNVLRSKKEVSVWRKVLLVNELYELSVRRMVSFQIVSLLCVLFLEGANWKQLAIAVPNTSVTLTGSSNILLSYFIITALVFVVAVGQLLLRYALRVWFPLPIEDFVDLCSISNISLMIFDQTLHGYYIHGVNPLGQSEGSLQQIEAIFEKQTKTFGMSRAFQLEDQDQLQTFEVVLPAEIRQAFQVKYKSRYLQKLAGKAYDISMLSKPVPDMLTDEDYSDIDQITNSMLQSFKFYLQGIKTSNMNVLERSFIERIIDCPLNVMGKLPVFLRDRWNSFGNVMLLGHELLLIINFANLVNAWYLATKSIWLAFLLALFVDKFIVQLFAEFMIRRNLSKNTLIDDKFFN